jgi:hypothetical protein
VRFARASIFFIATFTACVPLARAQTVPPALGADLLRSCSALTAYAREGGEITADATSCAAYLKGLRDAVEAARNPADRPFCAVGAGLHEMAAAIVKHVQERAENARRNAATEAFDALARAYPCTVKK